MIVKDGSAITDLNTWKRLAGPKYPNQWKDGRSAKEAAKSWLGALPSIPSAVAEALLSHPGFSLLSEWEAEPEARVRFDGFPGEPSNVDVRARGKDNYGYIVIAVEAKADEPFGRSLGQTLKKAESTLAENPRSKHVARIHHLAEALLERAPSELSVVSSIRYQLMTVSAAALAEAGRYGASRAVVMIQEFITPATRDRRHLANDGDLNAFLTAITGRQVEIGSGQVVGPISIQGSPTISSAIGLYIGKASVNLRHSGA